MYLNNKNIAGKRNLFSLSAFAFIFSLNLSGAVAQVRPVRDGQVVENKAAQPQNSARRGKLRLTSANRTAQLKNFQQIVDETVLEEAAKYGIDPLLIYALMSQESSFNPRAVSPKGARGLMQLMPGTAKRWGVKNPHDPREAIQGGTKYLVWLIDRFDGNVRLGLAGYNAGEGAVDKYNRSIPPYRETQDYVRKIEQKYLALKRTAQGSGARASEDRRQATRAAQAAETKGVTPSYSYRFRVSTSAEGHAVTAPSVGGGTH